MRKKRKGKRRVDGGLYRMVVSCCCFITVNPGATSCSNPNMTTDPYGKPFRTVLGHLCEIKRLTAIFKRSCTLSSHLPCGLLPSQIIFVYDHLTNDFCQSEKKKDLLRCTKKKPRFGLLHSDSSKASPFFSSRSVATFLHQNLCSCVILTTHTAVSLFSSGSSSSSACVIADHEVETALLSRLSRQ